MERADQQTARRRAAGLAAQLTTSSPATAGTARQVGFWGENYLPVQPPSADSQGGPGRAAWPELAAGGPAMSGWREHQEARRQAETGGSSLWRVHGKMYDLTKFMDRHPGGRVWLELTRGTDATQGFEAYHLDGPRVEAVLERYYVRDAAPEEMLYGQRFSFAPDGFWRTLRKRVLARLKERAGPGATTREATAATGSMRAASAVCVGQFLAAVGMAAQSGSLAAAGLAGFGMIGMWGVGHNWMHQATRKAGLLPYCMDVWGHHAADWRISHALSHHLDTNLASDWEYANFFPSYTDEGNALGAALPAAIPGYGVLTLANCAKYLVGTAREVASGAGRSVGKHAGHLLPGLLPLLNLTSYVHSAGLARGVTMYMCQSAVSFLGFVPLSAGVHHAAPDQSEAQAAVGADPDARNTFAWMEGQAGAETDFGAHQVAATTDHAVKTLPERLDLPEWVRHWWSLTLYGYLNNHTLHHLFPGVDHSRLQGLNDILEETAKEFGIPLKNVREYSTFEVFKGYFNYMLGRQNRARL